MGDTRPTVAFSHFGAILDELRRDGRARHSAGRPATRPRSKGPEPTLSLGSYLRADGGLDVRARRGLALPASIVLHAAGVAALALVPLLVAEELPVPDGEVRAFFVAPIAAAPPPPPPPPAPVAAATRVAPPTPTAATPGFLAPIEAPTGIRPEEGFDLGGIEGEVAGGVEGGVPGGVVGGIVGGLPDAPPPTPSKPVRVGGAVQEPRKVLDVAPLYPRLAARAGIKGTVVIEALVDPRGRVAEATVLKGVPALDEAALEAVRRWVYTPTLIDGVPTPIIMTVTVRFDLRSATS